MCDIATEAGKTRVVQETETVLKVRKFTNPCPDPDPEKFELDHFLLPMQSSHLTKKYVGDFAKQFELCAIARIKGHKQWESFLVHVELKLSCI